MKDLERLLTILGNVMLITAIIAGAVVALAVIRLALCLQ